MFPPSSPPGSSPEISITPGMLVEIRSRPYLPENQFPFAIKIQNINDPGYASDDNNSIRPLISVLKVGKVALVLKISPNEAIILVGETDLFAINPCFLKPIPV